MAENKKASNNHVWLNFSEGATLSLVRFWDKNEKYAQDAQNVVHARSRRLRHKVLSAIIRARIVRLFERRQSYASYINLIYVEILRVAIHYGANKNVIRGIKQLFDQQHNDSFTTTLSPLAEVLLDAHNGMDVEFTYTYDGDCITLYDYLFAPLFLGTQHEPRMQFSLIPLINRVRSVFKNLPEIEAKHSMYNYFIVSDSENAVIEMARSLKGADRLEIKRYGGETGEYLASIERAQDEELAKKFNAFCKENGIANFTDITIKRRNGGVANVKRSVPKIV